MKKLALLIIDFYRLFLSFDRGALSVLSSGEVCKYSPSCSLYTKQMIENYGVIKGGMLGFKRILSCR